MIFESGYTDRKYKRMGRNGELVCCEEDGSTHYYESFVWEKGKGLVEFRSGFRVEADILYIENITKQ